MHPFTPSTYRLSSSSRGDPRFIQRIEINLVERGPVLYPGVHMGLSVIRLVSLVVPVAPVANQVDYDVLCELVR